jgi:DNA-binding protein H-NS
MADRLAAAKVTADAFRPEVVKLREQIVELKRHAAKTTKAHARDKAELETTIKTYANQIQALALANNALHEANRILRDRLESHNPEVIHLIDHR